MHAQYVSLTYLPVYLQLYASGERERLKRLLNERLTECGWKEGVKQLCRGVCSCNAVSPLHQNGEREAHA
jgi:hypothetical protein